MIFRYGLKKLKELSKAGHWLGRSVTTDRMYDIEQHLKEMSRAIVEVQSELEDIRGKM